MVPCKILINLSFKKLIFVINECTVPEFCTVSPVLESSRTMRSPFRNVRKEDPSPVQNKVKLLQKYTFGFMKISILNLDPNPLDPYKLGLLDPDSDP
jgi:hypothetical protein